VGTVVFQDRCASQDKSVSHFKKKTPLSDMNNVDFLLKNFNSMLKTADFSHKNPYLELKERSKEIVRERIFCCKDVAAFIKELETYQKEYKGNKENFKICANSLFSVIINEGPSLRGEPLVLPLTTLHKLAGVITTREENLVISSEASYTQGELVSYGVPMQTATELGLKIRKN